MNGIPAPPSGFELDPEEIPAPPEGFELDENIPDPPLGFTMDQSGDSGMGSPLSASDLDAVTASQGVTTGLPPANTDTHIDITGMVAPSVPPPRLESPKLKERLYEIDQLTVQKNTLQDDYNKISKLKSIIEETQDQSLLPQYEEAVGIFNSNLNKFQEDYSKFNTKVEEEKAAFQKEWDITHVPEKRGLPGYLLSTSVRGMVNAIDAISGQMRLTDMDPKAETNFIAELGGSINDWSKKIKREYDILKPDPTEGKGGLLKEGVGGTLESLPMSALPFAAGYAASIPFTGGTSLAVGGIVGGATLFSTFFAGTYQNEYDKAYDKLLKDGYTKEVASTMANDYAIQNASAEFFTETAGDLAGATFFKLFSKSIAKNGLKQTVKELVSPKGIDAVTSTLKTIPFETGSEMTAAYIQNEAARQIGLSDQSTEDAVKSAIIPSILMSMFFGTTVHMMERYQASNLLNNLNSENIDTRLEAFKEIATRLTPEERVLWVKTAAPYLAKGQPILINKSIADMATLQEEQAQKRRDAIISPQDQLLNSVSNAVDNFNSGSISTDQLIESVSGQLDNLNKFFSPETVVEKPPEKAIHQLTSEELSQLPIEEQQRHAFGMADKEIISITPDKLSPAQLDDPGLLQARQDQVDSGLSPEDWARKIDLTQPAKASLEGGTLNVTDGFHKVIAAEILGQPLNVEVSVKENPLLEIHAKNPMIKWNDDLANGNIGEEEHSIAHSIYNHFQSIGINMPLFRYPETRVTVGPEKKQLSFDIDNEEDVNFLIKYGFLKEDPSDPQVLEDQIDELRGKEIRIRGEYIPGDIGRGGQTREEIAIYNAAGPLDYYEEMAHGLVNHELIAEPEGLTQAESEDFAHDTAKVLLALDKEGKLGDFLKSANAEKIKRESAAAPKTEGQYSIPKSPKREAALDRSPGIREFFKGSVPDVISSADAESIKLRGYYTDLTLPEGKTTGRITKKDVDLYQEGDTRLGDFSGSPKRIGQVVELSRKWFQFKTKFDSEGKQKPATITELQKNPEEAYYSIEAKAKEKKAEPSGKGVVGPPKKFIDKVITATHWSPQKSLTVLDPKKYGKGVSGSSATVSERTKATYRGFIPRSFLGTEGYTKEYQLGDNMYKALLEGNKIYDLDKDPLGLYPTNEEMRKSGYGEFDMMARDVKYDSRILKAGFDGAYSDTHKVIMMFKPVSVESVPHKNKALPLSGKGSYSIGVLPKTFEEAVPDLKRLGWTQERIDDMMKDNHAKARANFINHVNNVRPEKEILPVYKAGEVNKEWYQQLLDNAVTLMKGDKKRADLLMKLNAAFSPNMSVELHLAAALKALYRYEKAGSTKDPRILKRLFQGLGLENSIDNAIRAIRGERLGLSDTTGNKVRSFEQNSIGNLDPVTLDVYMSFIYDKKTYHPSTGENRWAIATDPIYSAVAMNVMKTSEKLGWQPAEGQAAAWSTAAALADRVLKGESPEDAVDNLTYGDIVSEDTTSVIKKGWETPASSLGSAMRDIGITRAEINKLKSTEVKNPDRKIVEDMSPEDIKTLKAFAKELDNVRVQRELVSITKEVPTTLNFESMSTVDKNADVIAKLPYRTQMKMHKEIVDAIKSYIQNAAKTLGIKATLAGHSPGSWVEEGTVYSNPSSMYNVMSEDGKVLPLTKENRKKVEGLLAYIGYILDQAGMGYTKAMAPSDPRQNQPLAWVLTKEPLTRKEVIYLQKELGKKMDPAYFFIAPHEKGVYIGNVGRFEGKLSNEDFIDHVTAVLETSKISDKVTSWEEAENGGGFVGRGEESETGENGYQSKINDAGVSELLADIDTPRDIARNIKEKYSSGKASEEITPAQYSIGLENLVTEKGLTISQEETILKLKRAERNEIYRNLKETGLNGRTSEGSSEKISSFVQEEIDRTGVQVPEGRNLEADLREITQEFAYHATYINNVLNIQRQGLSTEHAGEYTYFDNLGKRIHFDLDPSKAMDFGNVLLRVRTEDLGEAKRIRDTEIASLADIPPENIEMLTSDGKWTRMREPGNYSISSGSIIKDVSKEGYGKSYQILDNGKVVGHISGYESVGRFKLRQTQIDETVRGTGLYQKAIQQVANQFPDGLISSKYQTSKPLEKSLLKMETAEDNGEDIIIHPEEPGRYSIRANDEAYLKAVESGDMKTAQKMVDEAAKKAGYVQQAYHGTEDGGFTEFDPEQTSKKTGFVYLSTGRGTAASYSGSSKSLPAGAEGPGVWNLYVKKPEWSYDFEESAWDGTKPDGTFNDYYDFGGIDGIAKDAIDAGIESFEVRNVLDEGPNGDSAWYDTTIAVANPSQIKSADPVTYDDQGNVIPLSQRFNPENPDIRYSIRASVSDTDLTKKIVRNNDLYKMFLNTIDAGPLDGGCWIMAKALQAVKGGELYTIVGKTVTQTKPIANHVVLKVGDEYWDADGKSTEKKLLTRWDEVEGVKNPTLRPFKEGDVAEASRDKKLVDKVVSYLTEGEDYSIRANDEAYLKAVESGDMKTAQKMVDEAANKAGYTTGPVFHGTDSELIKVFNKNAYFISSDTEAGEYGKNVNGYYIPPPVDIGLTHEDVAKNRPKAEREIKNSGESVVIIPKDQNFADINVYSEAEHDVYIVNDPSMIKSADPVTYDDQGNVIPLSQRFNPENPDIRYSIRASLSDADLTKKIVRNNDLYKMFLNTIDAGPLDGGCWVMAKALQSVKGGDLYTIVGKTSTQTMPIANHVVLKTGNYYWDADGKSTEKELLQRWSEKEGVKNPTLRPFKEGDVAEASRDKNLVDNVVSYLTEGEDYSIRADLPDEIPPQYIAPDFKDHLEGYMDAIEEEMGKLDKEAIIAGVDVAEDLYRQYLVDLPPEEIAAAEATIKPAIDNYLKAHNIKPPVPGSRTSKTKHTIRDLTGQIRGENITANTYDLLLTRLRAEAKAAREGYSAGRELESEKAKAHYGPRIEAEKQRRRESLAKTIAKYRMKAALAKEHRRQQAEIRKMIEHLKTVESKLDKMDPVYRDRIKAVLEPFDLARMTEKTRLKLEDLKAELETNPDADIDPEWIDRIGRLDKTPIRDLTLFNMRILHDAIMHFAQLGIRGPQMKVAQKMIARDMILKTSLSEMKPEKSVVDNVVDIRYTKGRSFRGAMQGIKEQFGIHGIAWDALVESITGNDTMFYKILYRMIKDGIKQRDQLKYELEDEFINEMDRFQQAYGIKDIADWLDETQDINMGDNLTLRLSRNQKLSFYRGAQDPDWRRSAEEGGFGLWADPNKSNPNRVFKLGKGGLDPIIAAMTPSEKAFADRAIPNIIKSGNLIADKFLELNGYEMPMPEDGIYWRKDTMSGELGKDEEKELQKQHLGRPGIFKGMTKKRTNASLAVWLKPFTVAMADMHKRAADYVAMEEPISNAAWLLYKMRPEFENRYGQGLWKEIEKGLKDISDVYALESSPYADKLFQMIRNNQTVYSLALNYGTMLKQLNGPFNYMVFVPPKYLAWAMSQYIQNPLNVRKLHRRMSVEYRKRGEEGYTQDVGNVLSGLNQYGQKAALMKRAGAAGLRPLREIDLFGVDLGMLASVEYALDSFKTGMPEFMSRALDVTNEQVKKMSYGEQYKLAYEFAEWVTERTQAQNVPEHMSGWQRGNELEKQFSMFFSEVQKNLSGIYRAAKEMERGEEKAKALMMKTLFFYMIIGSILFDTGVNALRSKIRGQRPDTWWAGITKNITGMVPVVRDIVQTLVDSMQGKYYPSGGDTPAARLQQAIVNPVANAVKTWNAKTRKQKIDAAWKTADSMANMVAMALGIPYPAMKEPYRIVTREETIRKQKHKE